MRWLLFFWGLPLALFWGWYFVSLNDMHMGYVMLTREANDLVFELYGNVLGIDPAVIPGMVAKACVVDSFLLAGILAFRRRKAITAWLRQRRELQEASSAPSA
ncbi:MAG TPA: DUF6105 family protein [Mesorhizobium sp.]|jgi:hypothetical protein|nr:DUF6105 family protein [Mesorhizobium sp.]